MNVNLKHARNSLERAKEAAGGSSGLAYKLGGITSQAVSQWDRVPVGRVLKVEGVTGISRHDLRPDVFGPAPEPLEAAE